MPLTLGVFPASGGLGTSVYTHLLTTLDYPAHDVILISRHPSKTPTQFTAAGVVTRQASFESSRDELAAAFSGIDVLLLVSYPSHDSEHRIAVHTAALDAAVRGAGVGHLFYSSLAFAGGEDTTDSAGAEVMRAHLATEEYLRELEETDEFPGGGRFTWTSVREGLYAESFPIYLAFLDPAAAVREGSGAAAGAGTVDVRIPHPPVGGGGVAWAARDELGEATARLMVAYASAPRTFPHANRNVLLSGPKAWTLGETAAALGRIYAGDGREDAFRIVECSVDEYAAQEAVVKKFGDDGKLARTWATAWPAIRAGATGVVTDRLAEVLGREPMEFEEAVRALQGAQGDRWKSWVEKW